jgi:hypothetical protein
MAKFFRSTSIKARRDKIMKPICREEAGIFRISEQSYRSSES